MPIIFRSSATSNKIVWMKAFVFIVWVTYFSFVHHVRDKCFVNGMAWPNQLTKLEWYKYFFRETTSKAQKWGENCFQSQTNNSQFLSERFIELSIYSSSFGASNFSNQFFSNHILNNFWANIQKISDKSWFIFQELLQSEKSPTFIYK